MPETAYFDACIFSWLLGKRQTEDKYKACESLWVKATQDKPELIIYTSVFSIVECNLIEGSKAPFKEQNKQILDFFAHPAVIIRATDRHIAEVAQALIRAYGITNIDAIHVATALERRVDVLYTFDGAKERGKKGKRSDLIYHDKKIGSPPLRIEAPPDPLAGTAFDKKMYETEGEGGASAA